MKLLGIVLILLSIVLYSWDWGDFIPSVLFVFGLGILSQSSKKKDE